MDQRFGNRINLREKLDDPVEVELGQLTIVLPFEATVQRVNTARVSGRMHGEGPAAPAPFGVCGD